MRVTWVHPSWRDLVIEHLATDDDARARFLRGCSVHGALLALSVAGGRAGERRLPLLRHDRDWDALTDRLYELVPELEPAELIGLLDGVARKCSLLPDATSDREVDALARALLARVGKRWNAAGTPIPLPELEAWLVIAHRLSPKPDLPRMAVTWTELLPVTPPDLGDLAALERFADWLTLADMLSPYRPLGVLAGQVTGFLQSSVMVIDDFLSAVEQGFIGALEHESIRPGLRETDQVVRALALVPAYLPSRGERVARLLFRLRPGEPRLDTPMPPAAGPPEFARELSGALDVERVLSDL